MDIKGFEMLAGTGTPVQGATVELRAALDTHPNTGAILQSTTTDVNGMWQFTGVTPGAYDVKVINGNLVKWYKGNSKITLAAIGESGRGLLHLIDRRVLGSAVNTIDFVQIPTDYVDLEVLLDGRTDNAVTSQQVAIEFSTNTTSTPTPDSGANYDTEPLFGSGGAASAAESFGATQGNVGLLAGASAGASLSGSVQVLIPNAMGTTFNKGYIAISRTKYGTAAGNMFTQVIGGNWRNSGQIRQVRLLVTAGNFIAGTVCELWGRAAA